MKFQNGTIYFQLPSFFASPLNTLIAGIVIGILLVIVYRMLFKAKPKAPSSFSSKADSLGNINPTQIISRTKAVISSIKAFYRLKDMVNVYKPLNNDNLQKYNNEVNQGLKLVLSDQVDFYEFIGNWEKLKNTVNNNISKIEETITSKAISSDEMRREARQEINKIKESINNRVL